jgi:tRNA (guanine-N7-)-methyltransferase
LELGCGKENIQLVWRNIPINFVGMILRSSFFECKTAVDEGLQNVAFIRTQIELINHILPKMKWMKSGLLSDPQIKNTSTNIE